MTEALARTGQRAPTVTPSQRELIKKTVAVGATDEELKLFFYDCARRNVHPLDKLIHFTKRDEKYVPISSIDFMRSRAAESGEYAGNDDPIFKGKTADKKYPKQATVTVYRMVCGTRCPFTATARWAEYVPAKPRPGKKDQGFMWRKMPHNQLGKCAEALALRKGFPQQVAGLYAIEEFEQAREAQVGRLMVEDEDAPKDAVTEAELSEPPAGTHRIVNIEAKKTRGKDARVYHVLTVHTGEFFYLWATWMEGNCEVDSTPFLRIAETVWESGEPVLIDAIKTSKGQTIRAIHRRQDDDKEE